MSQKLTALINVSGETQEEKQQMYRNSQQKINTSAFLFEYPKLKFYPESEFASWPQY
jgi:hypothetical protein